VVYSDTFKNKMVERMLMPNARSVAAIARDTGVSQSVLYGWRQAATLALVSTDRPDDRATSHAKPPQGWSPEDKVATVLEAAAIPEAELGAFLRRKGGARGTAGRVAEAGDGGCGRGTAWAQRAGPQGGHGRCSPSPSAGARAAAQRQGAGRDRVAAA